MPTQIIDGFRLNAATPIDTRIVAANAAQRNNIQFKYEGLRVFDLTDKTGYVWLDGQWKEEGTTSKTGNTGGGFGGGGGGAGGSALGTLDRVPKFGATGLTNSIITESLKNGQYFVGIGKQQTSFKLEVDGSVKATTFIGNIDGSYVVVDSLPLDRIKKPTAAGNYLLKYDGTSVVWATETAAANVGVTNTTAPSATHYLLFSESAQSTSATLRANQHDPTKLLGFKPDTSQILATPLDIPAYSFVGQTSTGFYGTATEVGVKIQDKKVFNALGAQTNIGILTSSGGVPQLVGSIAMTINNVKIAQQTIIKDYVKIDVVSTKPSIEFSASKFSNTNLNGQITERIGYIDFNYGNVNNFGGGGVSGTNHALRMILKNVAGDTTEYAGVQVLMNTSGKKYVRIASTLGDTQAASGMILQSTDANGTLGWASLPASVPYGSIIIWHRGQATIPDGWKVCNGVGYIYLSQVNAYGSTSMEYVKVPDYRDHSIFGLPNGYTDMDAVYGTLSPTVVNHDFKLAGGQLPAHVHFSRLPKHRHNMLGSADSESSTTNITSSGSHTHKLYSDKTGPNKGPNNKVDVFNQDGDDPYELGPPYIQASSHTHGKENFEGFTSFRVYDNAASPAEGVYFNTGPSSNWQDIDKPDNQWTNLNAFGGNLASISIPQRKAKVVLFIIKYNPNATQNQDGHFSFSSTGADAPAPSPSPSPSPGVLSPNFPSGGVTGETSGSSPGAPYIPPLNNG